MCYLARQQLKAPLGESTQSPPSEIPSLRPRWVGAAAAAVVAMTAAAAMLAPMPSPSTPAEEASVGPTPVASNESLGGGSVDRTALSPDDGVPSSDNAGVSLAGRSCHHGL